MYKTVLDVTEMQTVMNVYKILNIVEHDLDKIYLEAISHTI